MNGINKMKYQQDHDQNEQPASRTKVPLSSQYKLPHQGRNRKLHNSNSSHLGRRSPNKHIAQQSGDDIIAMANQSMIQLQDPSFIANEIDDFEARLDGNTSRGFCKLSREKSLLLSNTQGYRKYKQEHKQADNVRDSRLRTDLVHKQLGLQIIQEQQPESSKSALKEQEISQSRQAEKQIEMKSSSSSLCYSKESAVGSKKQSEKSFVFQNNSKISNNDSEVPQPNMQARENQNDGNSKRINNVKSL